MVNPNMSELWHTLNRARELRNSAAIIAAGRAIRAAGRGHNSDSVAWFLLAEYELAHPSENLQAKTCPENLPGEQENSQLV